MLDKATLQSIVRADLELEYQSAQVLQRNLATARNQITKQLQVNPDNLHATRLASVLDTYLGEFESKSLKDLPLEEALSRGSREGMEIIGASANVPKDSTFWNFVPTLPTQAIALESAKAADSIRKVSKQLKDDILRKVQVGLVTGAGTQSLISDIMGTGLKGLKGRDGVFRSASVRAETIGRTISNELINKGAHITYTQVDKVVPELELTKVWQTVSDNRTSDRCNSLAGQRKPLDALFTAGDGWSGLYPPSHPNCRSRITTVSKRYSKEWDDRFPTVAPANRQPNKQPKLPKLNEKIPLPNVSDTPQAPFIKLNPNTSLAQNINEVWSDEEFATILNQLPRGGDLAKFINTQEITYYWINAEKDGRLQWMEIWNKTNNSSIKNLSPKLVDQMGTYINERTHKTYGWTTHEYQIVILNYKSELKTYGLPSVTQSARINTVQLKNPGNFFSFSSDMPESNEKLFTVLHETGHQVHFAMGKPPIPSHLATSVTQYGAEDDQEWFAEHFAAWMVNPKTFTELYPDKAQYIQVMFDSALKAAGVR